MMSHIILVQSVVDILELFLEKLISSTILIGLRPRRLLPQINGVLLDSLLHLLLILLRRQIRKRRLWRGVSGGSVMFVILRHSHVVGVHAAGDSVREVLGVLKGGVG